MDHMKPVLNEACMHRFNVNIKNYKHAVCM